MTAAASVTFDTKAWCGIPVYNNAGTIQDIARRCRAIMPMVIVVDDGSTDADLRALLADQDVVVIRHDINHGKGAALRTMFDFAREAGGEYLISLDGDGQHFPEDLPHFWPALSPDAIVIGYRDEVVGAMPRASRFGRAFSDFWIGLETGWPVRDTQSGFRAYPLGAVAKLKCASPRYHFEMEIVTRAVWSGLRVLSVPVRVRYAADRVSSFDPLRDNARISLLHFRLIVRQLLPVPHRKTLPWRAVSLRRRIHKIVLKNSTPAALAVACAISLVLSVVLWPFGWFVALYLAARLHMNKIAVLACLGLAMLPVVPRLNREIGRRIVQSPGHDGLEWFVGSHVVAAALMVPVVASAILIGRVIQRGWRA